jgi:hypothetical protein
VMFSSELVPCDGHFLWTGQYVSDVIFIRFHHCSLKTVFPCEWGKSEMLNIFQFNQFIFVHYNLPAPICSVCTICLTQLINCVRRIIQIHR